MRGQRLLGRFLVQQRFGPVNRAAEHHAFANANQSFGHQPLGMRSALVQLQKLVHQLRRHWLWKTTAGSNNHVDTLGHEQMPSPDGNAEGAITWYDYEGKDYLSPQIRGSRIEPAVIAVVQPNGTTSWVKYERNGWGKPTNIITKWVEAGNAKQRSERYVYSGDGVDLLEKWHHNGTSEHRDFGISYNSDRQPLRHTNALGEITVFTYSNKKLSTETSPAGLVSTYSYGANNGYLERVVDSVSGTPFRTNQYSWSNQRLQKHTNELGLVLTYTWDALGRLTRLDFPDSTYLENVYQNGSGTKFLDPLGTKDRLGNWTYFSYNFRRQVARHTNAIGTITGYGYCDCGTLQAVTNGVGTAVALVTTYNYDNQSRLLNVYGPGGINITNQYDSLGRLTNVLDAAGGTTNWYDGLGRLVLVTNALGRVRSTVYDTEDRVTSSTDANGVTTTFTYDALGRVRTQTLSGGGTNAFGYTANVTAGPTTIPTSLAK
jgi:YD repeat-containing protein